MKIVRIIAELDSLLSVHNEDEADNEFELVFKNWNDIEYLNNFFKGHKKDLDGITVGEAINKTLDDAEALENELIEVAESNAELQTLFKPLSNNEFKLKPYQKSKAYGTLQKSWLRLYAVRIHSDLFVITGGAIKLTRTMAERKHTEDQLNRITKTRDYLKERGFSEADLNNLEAE